MKKINTNRVIVKYPKQETVVMGDSSTTTPTRCAMKDLLKKFGRETVINFSAHSLEVKKIFINIKLQKHTSGYLQKILGDLIIEIF